jgi:hypothetical protein
MSCRRFRGSGAITTETERPEHMGEREGVKIGWSSSLSSQITLSMPAKRAGGRGEGSPRSAERRLKEVVKGADTP